MLFILSAVGIVAGLILGLDGLMLGRLGELERIFAIACFAMAAAGLVGLFTDDGIADRKPHRKRVEHGDVLHAIAVAPIMLLSVAVFVATLLPAIVVMLPVFVVWWYGFEPRPGRTPRPPTPATRPMHAPAYA